MADDPLSRVQKYIADYKDAPSWGGPTMYPKPPSITDLEVLVAAATPQPELKDDPSFRHGRQLLIEGGEKAIDMIASGNFYEDYDASTEALGDLRSLLDVVKDTLK
jgi:hypothetical protein